MKWVDFAFIYGDLVRVILLCGLMLCLWLCSRVEISEDILLRGGLVDFVRVM